MHFNHIKLSSTQTEALRKNCAAVARRRRRDLQPRGGDGVPCGAVTRGGRWATGALGYRSTASASRRWLGSGRARRPLCAARRSADTTEGGHDGSRGRQHGTLHRPDGPGRAGLMAPAGRLAPLEPDRIRPMQN